MPVIHRIPATALQLASLALAPHLPEYGNPRRLLAALERDVPQEPPAPKIAPPASFRTLTPEQAAEKMGVCTRTILYWVRTGKLPAKKYGRRTIRILESDLAAFVTPTNSPPLEGGA